MKSYQNVCFNNMLCLCDYKTIRCLLCAVTIFCVLFRRGLHPPVAREVLILSYVALMLKPPAVDLNEIVPYE